MYILECADRSLYVGSTKNLGLSHCAAQQGDGAEYTRTRRPVTWLSFEDFSRVDDAVRRAKQVQGGVVPSGLALVNGEYGQLPALSRKRFRA